MIFIGYAILTCIASIYVSLLVDDYIQVIRRSRLQGKEVAQYVALRAIRDAFILAAVLFMFYAAGQGYLDK